MGTPYTFVRQTSIVASAGRIFPCIEDFRAWRAWSPWRQLDPGVREYGAPSFGVGAHYRWSGNREAGARSMALTHSDPPRQHSDPPRKIEIDLVFVKPFPNRSRIEFILDEKRGQTSGEWRPHGEFTGAMRFFRLFFNMDIAVGRDLARGLERLRQAVKSDQEASRAGRTERTRRTVEVHRRRRSLIELDGMDRDPQDRSENSAGTLSTACAIGVDPSPKGMTLPMLAGSASTAAATAATFPREV